MVNSRKVSMVKIAEIRKITVIYAQSVRLNKPETIKKRNCEISSMNERYEI